MTQYHIVFYDTILLYSIVLSTSTRLTADRCEYRIKKNWYSVTRKIKQNGRKFL